MKKILFLLLLCGMAYGQTRTTYLKLPQWSTGDTLKAGTANDTAQSNFSLNNAFARLESILKNAGLTSGADSGYFSVIKGAGGTDLTINPGYSSGTVRRLIVSDSLYTLYNATFDQNMLISGNLLVGGYITTDSIVSSNTITFNSIQTLGGGGIKSYAGGGIVAYGGGDISTSGLGNILSSGNLATGTAGTQTGQLHMELLSSGGEPSGMTLAPVDGDYNDALYLPHKDGGAAWTDTLVTQNGNQNVTSVASVTYTERSDTPSDPSSGGEARIYVKGDKLIIQFNDGGTVRYKYLDLTGTGVTWTHTTTPP